MWHPSVHSSTPSSKSSRSLLIIGRTGFLCLLFIAFYCLAPNAPAVDEAKPENTVPAAKIDGIGPDWRALGKDDFANVNCDEDTWSFPGEEIHCTGSPVGVMRLTKELTNFELVVEWRHLKSAGNSGVFPWASEASLSSHKRGGLPASRD